MDKLFLLEKAFSATVFIGGLYSFFKTCNFTNTQPPTGRYLEFFISTDTNSSIKIPVGDNFRLTNKDLNYFLNGNDIQNLRETNLFFEINNYDLKIKIHKGFIVINHDFKNAGVVNLKAAQVFNIGGVINARYIAIDH